MIKVVVVDDHPVVRRGLKQLISRALDLKVVGEAAGIAEARRVIRDTGPDVVCCDLKLSDGDGTRLIAWVRDCTSAVPMVLTTYDQPELVRAALSAGAKGYLLKDAEDSVLFDAVRQVGMGRTAYSTAVSRILGDLEKQEALSYRELEVLRLAAEGATNSAIARKLGIQEGTVKTYFARIYAKLGVASKTQAVVKAIEGGLIGPKGGFSAS